MSKIIAIPVRARGTERNYVTSFDSSMPEFGNMLSVPSIGKFFLTDLFHNALIERLDQYLLEGDQILYRNSNLFNYEFYPLDMVIKPQDYNYDAGRRQALNEILALLNGGSILKEGTISSIVDSHLKTIILKVANYRPGNVVITFATPDVLQPECYSGKSLYAFLKIDNRIAQLETECSFSVQSI